MEDLQVRYSKLKEEKDKLVEEITRLKQRTGENISATVTVNWATTSKSPVLQGLAAIQGMHNKMQVNSKVKLSI